MSFDTDSDVCKQSVFSSVTGECGVKKNTCKQGLVLPMESEIVNGKIVTKWKCLHKKEGKVDIQNGVPCK